MMLVVATAQPDKTLFSVVLSLGYSVKLLTTKAKQYPMGVLNKTLALLLIFSVLSSMAIVNIAIAEMNPSTLCVPDDFPTIQEAVGNANSGDTVYVKEGTYHGTVTIHKNVNLIGQNNQRTILHGTIEISNAVNVTIAGFTLSDSEQGINIESNSEAYSQVKIVSCNIISNKYGVAIDGAVWENTYDIQYSPFRGGLHVNVSGNNIASNTYGVSASYSHLTVHNNTLTDNRIFALLFEGIVAEVYENNITNNQKAGIEISSDCDDCTIHDNCIQQNGVGIGLSASGYSSWATNGGGNVAYRNNFIENGRQAALNFYNQSNNSGITLSSFVWDTKLANSNTSVGNYWSDYSSKYPNATDINSTGVADSPYYLYTYTWDPPMFRQQFSDHYPSIYPFETSKTDLQLLMPNSTNLPTKINSSDQSQNSSPIFVVTFTVASLVIAVGAAAVLIRHRHKR